MARGVGPADGLRPELTTYDAGGPDCCSGCREAVNSPVAVTVVHHQDDVRTRGFCREDV